MHVHVCETPPGRFTDLEVCCLFCCSSRVEVDVVDFRVAQSGTLACRPVAMIRPPGRGPCRCPFDPPRSEWVLRRTRSVHPQWPLTARTEWMSLLQVPPRPTLLRPPVPPSSSRVVIRRVRVRRRGSAWSAVCRASRADTARLRVLRQRLCRGCRLHRMTRFELALALALRGTTAQTLNPRNRTRRQGRQRRTCLLDWCTHTNEVETQHRRTHLPRRHSGFCQLRAQSLGR